MEEYEDTKKKSNKKALIIILGIVVAVIIAIVIIIMVNRKNYKLMSEYNKEYSMLYIDSYDKFKNNIDSFGSYYNSSAHFYTEEEDFDYDEYFKKEFEKGKTYVFLTLKRNGCGEYYNYDKVEIKNNVLNTYLTDYDSCGDCAYQLVTYVYELDKKYDINKINTKVNIKSERCSDHGIYKPIIYIYPKEDMNLTIKLDNKKALTYTYPKYNKEWNVHVTTDSNIYDYDTKRNYYALYWEGVDNTKIDTSVGFVVKGSDTVKFLEEKLAILGLNEGEINEFVIYWIDKLESNNYNYIYFRTTDEMNKYMKLDFSTNPDTLIRVTMDYAPLNKKVNVTEQKLAAVTRKGFTVVEWGGRKISY